MADPIELPKDTQTPSPGRYPRNVYVTAGASLLTDISSEMVIHLLPLFLASVLKASMPLIGIIEGLAETTASLTKLLSGHLSDRIGNRKWLTVAGYSLSFLARPLLAAAGGWPAILGARFADRFGKGVRSAPRDAIIADSVAADRRGDAFGFQRAADTLGAFVGLLIAIGVVYWSQQRDLQLERATFTTLVWLSMIPLALAVGLLLWGLRESRTAYRAAETPARIGLGAFDRRFRRALLCIALFTLGNSADAFIVLLAQQHGASVLTTLIMVLVFNGVYTLFAQPFGKLSDRVGRLTVVVVGWGFYLSRLRAEQRDLADRRIMGALRPLLCDDRRRAQVAGGGSDAKCTAWHGLRLAQWHDRGHGAAGVAAGRPALAVVRPVGDFLFRRADGGCGIVPDRTVAQQAVDRGVAHGRTQFFCRSCDAW